VQALWQNLEGELDIELGVDGEEDRTRGPVAELSHQAKAPELAVRSE
jgi:hypothetical protein